jgi:cell volume regulation protein A
MSNPQLYPIFLMAQCLILFLVAEAVLHASGFLAVYIGGLTIGNSRFVHKRSSMHFFDGFSWLAQLLMFFIFGMLIKPAELLPVAGVGIAIGVFIILFARPLAVWACMFPFKKIPAAAKFFVSWVGLRGAVPLIFATYVLAEDIENGSIMFNIVFFIMLVSLLVQGNTVPFVARILKLGEEKTETEKQLSKYDMEFSKNIKTAMTEIAIKAEHLKTGNCLMKMQIPEETLVVMVKRENYYFIPKGNTEIEVGDILFVIADNERTLRRTYRRMGIKY